MKRNLWRLFMALTMSSAGFLGTVLWFESGKVEAVRGDRKALARLSNSNNEVQRKPLKRVIWESVNKNDELFTGEAIRTAPNADAQLLFLKTGTLVHLDPDSLVVLEENEKGLSLDFLQGNLFVQSSGGGVQAEGLTLKTANGEIKLNSADMSLSKTQNGRVNLEVYRGEAELKQGGKKTALNKEKSAVLSDQGLTEASDRIQVLRPDAGETIFLNLSRAEKLTVTWKPLPVTYTVAIEMGVSRAALEKVANTSRTGDAGQIHFSVKPGRWYLRVVATNADDHLPTLASTVIPVLIEPKSAPALVAPRQDATLLRTSPDAVTEFKWSARHLFLSQVIEVGTDPQFTKPSVHESLAGDVSTFSAPLKDGRYYWRVTGFLKVRDKTESLPSARGNFAWVSQREVTPPKLLAPLHLSHISLTDAPTSIVALKWQTPESIERVKVTLEEKSVEGWKKILDQETSTDTVRVPNLKPAHYRWQASSLDPGGTGHPAPSTPFEFTIEEVQKLEWLNATSPEEYEFQTPTPSLIAHWKPLRDSDVKYRYKTVAEGNDLSTVSWQFTKQNLFDVSLPIAGHYQALVEALDTQGQILARSEVKYFLIKERPLLPAPHWMETTPTVLKTDGKGNLTFGWETVEGAANYLMILESSQGQVIEQKEVSRNTASLSRLKPGEYQVHLKSIDGLKRLGPDGDKRKIQVPNSSDIRAPVIKAMKVK